MFRVGQKVVCIGEFEDAEAAEDLGIALPTVDAVYTVRSLEHRGEVPSLRVIEITNPEITHRCGTFAEPAFDNECFRPVVEKKTDISIFTALLTPTPARSRELCGSDQS